MTERNWSTKTLAKQLVAYIKDDSGLVAMDTIALLLTRLGESIVEEEVGTSLDPWAEDE